MSQPIKDQGGQLVRPIGPKHINLVENVEVLLPVKIWRIPFIGFREEVENVSASQRPGPSSNVFPIGRKNINVYLTVL